MMTQDEKLKLESGIVEMLRTVFDPEIPVDVYSLGLVYRIEVSDEGDVDMDMTLTAPNCPIADFIFEDVREKVGSVAGVRNVNVNLVFDPVWEPSMMSEEAKVELGMA